MRLVDLNGPRRGVDAHCSITVDLAGARRIFVDATTAWPFASVTRAAHRLGKAVRRELGRSAFHRDPSSYVRRVVSTAVSRTLARSRTHEVEGLSTTEAAQALTGDSVRGQGHVTLQRSDARGEYCQ